MLFVVYEIVCHRSFIFAVRIETQLLLALILFIWRGKGQLSRFSCDHLILTIFEHFSFGSTSFFLDYVRSLASLFTAFTTSIDHHTYDNQYYRERNCSRDSYKETKLIEECFCFIVLAHCIICPTSEV